MKTESDYIKTNREMWDARADIHPDSDFYDMPGFLNGNTSLKSIELELLGDIKNKSVLHLQCHFGQDTLSMSRMGAKTTGVDFSDKAISKARELAAQLNYDAEFICCNIYDLPNHLNAQFDIVFTTYGTIGWLPDMDKWAAIVSKFLRPGGQFIFAEFHPAVWMFDNDFEKIAYDYFNTQSIIETEQGTYAQKDAQVNLQSITWNHSISEVFNSLVKNGLTIETLNEYNYSPYDCFNHTEEFEPGKFRIRHLQNNIPMVYAIKALKKAV